VLASSPMNGSEQRLKRALEIVYAIDGVSSAKVWQWPGRVAIAVKGHGHSDEALLARVSTALNALKEPDEQWEFGILQDP
jgi:hypothetical protein